nr:hypothetical protein [Tanacetum cinerariifolium]
RGQGSDTGRPAAAAGGHRNQPESDCPAHPVRLPLCDRREAIAPARSYPPTVPAMIAKTNTGSDFEGALTYGAGQRKGRGKEPDEAPLLVVANVIPGSPKEMAQDMQAVAGTSKKIRKPVWHTVLSWK